MKKKEINKKKLSWIITYSIQAILFALTIIFSFNAIEILTANDLSAIAGIVMLPLAMSFIGVSLIYSLVCLVIHLIKNQKTLTWVQLTYLLAEIILVITFMILLMI